MQVEHKGGSVVNIGGSAGILYLYSDIGASATAKIEGGSTLNAYGISVNGSELTISGSGTEVSTVSCITLWSLEWGVLNIRDYATVNIGDCILINENHVVKINSHAVVNMGPYGSAISVQRGSVLGQNKGGILDVNDATITGTDWDGIYVEGGDGQTFSGYTTQLSVVY